MISACGKEPMTGPGTGGKSTGDDSKSRSLAITPFEELNQSPGTLNSHADIYDLSVLKKDWRSYQELGSAYNIFHPTYSRMCRLKDGTYILGWHNTNSESDANGIDTFYALSSDYKTWTNMGYLWQHKDVYNKLGKPDVRKFTNPNFLQLSNGELMAIAAFRTIGTYSKKDCTSEQGLLIKMSSDGGRTWHDEKEIYHGPCWEAHLMELPSGEIQCFFSESRPWTSSSHSGTSMVCSKDGGKTWSPSLDTEPYRVMRKQWWNIKPSVGTAMWCFTYQMPVGVILNGTQQFAFAMESCNQFVINSSTGKTSAQFSIAIVFSNEDGSWDHLTGDEITPKEHRIDSLVERGAAPYLVQFHSGETLLAYGGRDSKQHLRLGNAKATSFGSDFDVLPDVGSWGALCMSSPHTVISNMRDSREGYENATIAMCKCHLDHCIDASRHPVTVDSNNNDWPSSDDALFVGSKCQAQATLRCSADGDNYYFLVEVLDETLSTSDYAYILLNPDDGSTKPGAKSRRVRIDLNGLKSQDQYAGGWKESEFGAKASSAYDGTPKDKTDTDHGFISEISIPRSAIAPVNGKLRVDFGYFDSTANVDDVVSNANDVQKWLIINNL